MCWFCGSIPRWYRLAKEIQNRRTLVKWRAAVVFKPVGILKFTVSFGDSNVFRNFKVGLFLLLAHINNDKTNRLMSFAVLHF